MGCRSHMEPVGREFLWGRERDSEVGVCVGQQAVQEGSGDGGGGSDVLIGKHIQGRYIWETT